MKKMRFVSYANRLLFSAALCESILVGCGSPGKNDGIIPTRRVAQTRMGEQTRMGLTLSEINAQVDPNLPPEDQIVIRQAMARIADRLPSGRKDPLHVFRYKWKKLRE